MKTNNRFTDALIISRHTIDESDMCDTETEIDLLMTDVREMKQLLGFKTRNHKAPVA